LNHGQRRRITLGTVATLGGSVWLAATAWLAALAALAAALPACTSFITAHATVKIAQAAMVRTAPLPKIRCQAARPSRLPVALLMAIVSYAHTFFLHHVMIVDTVCGARGVFGAQFGDTELTYLLSVDSRRRDRSMYPSPSEYVVPFDTPFRNVTSLEVLDATVPRTEKLVDVGSDTLMYAVGRPSSIEEWNMGLWATASARIRTVVLDHGDYDFQQLLDHLNQRLAAVALANNEPALKAFATSDPAERAGKLVFEREEPFTLLMSQSSLRHTLGFGNSVSVGSDEYDVVPGYTADRPLKASGAFVSKAGVFATEEVAVYEGPEPQEDKFIGYDSQFFDRGIPVPPLTPVSIIINSRVSVPPQKALLTRLKLHGRGKYLSINEPKPRIDSIQQLNESGASGFYSNNATLTLTTQLTNNVPYDIYYRCTASKNVSFDTLNNDFGLEFDLYNFNFSSSFTYDIFNRLDLVIYMGDPAYMSYYYGDNGDPTANVVYNAASIANDLDTLIVNPNFNEENGISLCFSVYGKPVVHAVRAPGVVDLTGPRFVSIRCPEIESHLFRDRVNEPGHPGLGIVKLRSAGFTEERMDFVAFPTRHFHPIGKLGKLTIQLQKLDGQKYNSHNVDHTLTLLLRYQRPSPA
jgi:hypothetical protein